MNKVRSFYNLAGLAIVGSHPQIEPLLWGTGLISWCWRQEVVFGKQLWFEKFRKTSLLIDVSGKYTTNEKRPETAAARNSGPVLPADPKGDRANRSSIPSITRHEQQIQELFTGFGKLVRPVLEPKAIREWNLEAFPSEH